MQRKYIYSALTVIAVALFGIIYTFVRGNEPLLGLDLQGGVSVVLAPTEEASDEQLETTINILRGRIDQIGVAEPEIRAQGQNIVVELPGVVSDQQDALDRLSQTAELVFRPVFFDPTFGTFGQNAAGGAGGSHSDDADVIGPQPDSGEGEDTEDAVGEDAEDEGDDITSDENLADEDSVDDAEEAVEVEPADDESDDTELSLGAGPTNVAFRLQDTDVLDDEDLVLDPDDLDFDSLDLDDLDLDSLDLDDLDAGILNPEDLIQGDVLFGGPAQCPTELSTTAEVGDDEFVTLFDSLGPVCLGPVLFKGDALESASANIANANNWLVAPVFKAGPEGIDLFNNAASLCFAADATVCPASGIDPQTQEARGRLAAVLDNEIISAPTINSPNFGRNQITITGGFTEEDARRTAEALNFGALPIELVAQETRTVSASIGGDVLTAGLISGLIGLGLVAVYLLFYYRLAGLVAIGGLILSALLLWTIIAFLGESAGLALSLAGVVGLIVSIGVSTDSNIVYFENVKEAYRTGTKVETSVERAYKTSISTIIKADVVSLVAAVVLYFLAVGAVRGFALYLGLATILDLVISLYFMRPALIWLASREFAKNNPKLVGMSRPAHGDSEGVNS